MQSWNTRFDALEITHLRSPAFAHPLAFVVGHINGVGVVCGVVVGSGVVASLRLRRRSRGASLTLRVPPPRADGSGHL